MLLGVQTIIAYDFTNTSILWEALQAPGALPLSPEGRNFSNGNKRLALLGDAGLKFVLLKEWYPTTGDIRAGNDSVAVKGSNANLAAIGNQHGLGQFINKNFAANGHVVSAGLMAQTVEAILGAVFEDTGSLNEVRAVMQLLGIF